jgi:ferredoxin-NADP reductase
VTSQDPAFSFKPGQWVDLFLPGLDTIGGFSLVSGPSLLPQCQLAIKEVDHPPAKWMHTTAAVGTDVHLRVGGNWFYDVAADMEAQAGKKRELVLISGGIGVGPMMGMLEEIAAALDAAATAAGGGGALPSVSADQLSVKVVCSFRSPQEAVFSDEIVAISERHPTVVSHFFSMTQAGEGAAAWAGRRGRIDQGYLAGVLAGTAGSLPGATAGECEPAAAAAGGGKGDGEGGVDLSNTLFFICGPPRMIDEVEGMCGALGGQAENVRVEKWW